MGAAGSDGSRIFSRVSEMSGGTGRSTRGAFAAWSGGAKRRSEKRRGAAATRLPVGFAEDPQLGQAQQQRYERRLVPRAIVDPSRVAKRVLQVRCEFRGRRCALGREHCGRGGQRSRAATREVLTRNR